MTIGENLTEFAGQPVRDFAVETGIIDPAVAYRIRVEWDDRVGWQSRFARFLADPLVSKITHLVIGMWLNWEVNDSSAAIVEAVADAQEQLPNLQALFVGDITYEETEISWIVQSDMSPLLNAYPRLAHFGVRGGNGLRFTELEHANLKSLVVETGGLDREVVHDILSGDLPALEHLELWLGTSDYGATVTPQDLAPLLTGNLYPHLRYLGLRDSEIADEVAAVVALSPLLERIEVLDLSLGTLTDEGAAALLENPSLHQLKKLDLHHHYLSPEMMDSLKGLPITVDVSDPQSADDEDGWRYVAVSE